MVSILFGVGLMRPAPGTWGSLAALVLAWAIAALVGPWGFVLVLIAATVGGWYAVRAEIAGRADKDPGEIVIDELAGQWVALLPVIIGAAHVHAPLLALWPGWVSGFLLFRLFDIWKPWLVRRADRMPGASGVMLDDLVAGIFAALVSILLAGIAHGLFLRGG